MFRLRPAAIACVASMAFSAGCGSGDDVPPGEPSGTVSCTSDPRLDAYAGELTKSGELGVLSFRFFDLDPAPPARGLNTFHVEVSSVAGAVTAEQLQVDLRMPDHGHGTSVTPVVSAEAAPGTYTVRQLFLFMPGVWRLDFDALGADGGESTMLDSVSLHFCVEG